MPFAFIIVGTVFVISGVRGSSKDLVALLRSDLTGQHSYLVWLISILVIGAVGYIEDLKPVSRAFLVLVLVVLILSNGGFFNLFNQSIQTITNRNQGVSTNG